MTVKYDFIAIGDTVTDAFIRLKEATVHCNINKEKCEICLRFADKIPYEAVYIVPAVGNSANAAVSASRLGLKTALISNIGDDYFGQECLAALKTEKVNTRYVKVHKNIKTNYHYVLWYEDERTILIKHEEYSFQLPDFGSPKWVYLSSLGGNSEKFHVLVEKYFNRHPGIKVAFQPGTYQIKMGKEKLKGIYQRSEVFFCNKEEAQRILGAKTENIKTLLKGICGLGPKIGVITDGPKGAYVYEGGNFWFMPAYPDPKPPYERTGAGDAFSSTFTAALALGLTVEEALRWGPVNSMSVVQYVGAREGLLNRKKLQEYLKTAPKNYKPVKI